MKLLKGKRWDPIPARFGSPERRGQHQFGSQELVLEEVQRPCFGGSPLLKLRDCAVGWTEEKLVFQDADEMVLTDPS